MKRKNVFGLYEDSKDADKATKELEGIINTFKKDLDKCINTYRKTGMADTASRDCIYDYIMSTLTI